MKRLIILFVIFSFSSLSGSELILKRCSSKPEVLKVLYFKLTDSTISYINDGILVDSGLRKNNINLGDIDYAIHNGKLVYINPVYKSDIENNINLGRIAKSLENINHDFHILYLIQIGFLTLSLFVLLL